MIDTALLAFTLGMVAYICVRAVLLDRALPWFPTVTKPGADEAVPPPASEEGRHPAAEPAAGWRSRASR